MPTIKRQDEIQPTKDFTSINMDDEILKLEFERIYALFEQSEEFGEKRTTLMITVTGFLFGGFFALLKDDSSYLFDHAFIFWLMMLANLFLLILGGMTLIRMTYRNLNTDDYKEAIKVIKKYYVLRSPKLNSYLYFGTQEELKNRKVRPSRGDYIEITKLINSVLFGVFTYMLLNYFFYHADQVVPGTYTELVVVVSIFTSGFTWMVQKYFTDKLYDRGYKEHQEKLRKLTQYE